MSKTRELLTERRREVEAEIAPLKAELKEIDAALTAITGGGRITGHAPTVTRAPSIVDQTLAILEAHPPGLPMRVILKALLTEYGREITPHSMSWHLSHMKRDNQLELLGNLWRILGAGPEKETPDSMSGAPNHHEDEGGAPSSNERGEAATSPTEPPGASPADPGP